jgi:hypothetical protein
MRIVYGQKRVRLATAIALVLMCGALLSACLVPPSTATRHLVYGATSPDPAWVSLGSGGAEVYTTDAFWRQTTRTHWAHVLSYHSPIPNPHATGIPHDALPTIPTQSSGYIWAPTVRYIDGRYVMLFAESVSGRADCIGGASSNTGSVFTPDNYFELCTSNPAVGYLDPSLFIGETGTIYVLFSRQEGPNGSPDGGSQILTQRLTVTGLGTSGNPYQILTYSQVSSFNSDNGNSSFLENPSMTNDAHNEYDLTFSIGSWNTGTSDSTGEVPCLAVTGYCLATKGSLIMTGAQGASTLSGSDPTNNWLIWDHWNGSHSLRYDVAGPTSQVNLNSEASAQAVNRTTLPLPAAAPAVPPIAHPYHWTPRVYNPTLATVVIGAT